MHNDSWVVHRIQSGIKEVKSQDWTVCWLTVANQRVVKSEEIIGVAMQILECPCDDKIIWMSWDRESVNPARTYIHDIWY